MSRSKRIAFVAAAIAFVVIGMSGGCFAHKRPPAPNVSDRLLLKTAPLPYSVTVAWWDDSTKTGQSPEAYGDALARLVIPSGTFRSGRYERTSAPTGQDLVATSTGVYCNTAIIPVLSILSLGLIPTVFQDEHCQGMLLRNAAGQLESEAVQIDVRYTGTVIMGWAAVVVGALPGWSYGSIESDSRFVDRFRLAVFHRRADIDRLVQR